MPSESKRPRSTIPVEQLPPDGHDFPSVADTLKPGGSKGTPRAIMESGSREFTDLPMCVLEGRLPDDLRGHVFIAGPRSHVGQPTLSSNGIIYRIDLSGGAGATISSRAMRTASYYARRAVNQLGFFRQLFVDQRLNEFRAVGVGQFSLTLGPLELPNTAPVVIPSSGRMIIASDAGRPWQIDPRTLRTLSPIGYLDEWRPAIGLPWMFPLLQSTPHAAVDPPTNDLYISNHAPDQFPCTAFTDVCRWREDDPRLRHWRLRDVETGEPVAVQTLHQLAVTRHHVVLLDSDFAVNFPMVMAAIVKPWIPIPTGLVERLFSTETAAVATLWVVCKADLIDSPQTLDANNPPIVQARRYTLGTGGLHVAVDYEDRVDGKSRIRLVTTHTPTEDLSHVLRAGEPLEQGGTVPDYLDGMLTPVPIIRGSVAVHELDLERGLVESRTHESDRFTWGIGVFTHAGSIQGELHIGRHRMVRNLWLNAGGFARDNLPTALYELYKNRGGPVDSLPKGTIPSSLFRIDTDTGNFDGWELPEGWYGFAPTYVPSAKPGVDVENGYVVLTALSDPSDALPKGSSGDELWIFEAQNIARGPICRLGNPDLKFGMTLHSVWLKELPPAPTTNRVDLRKDLNADAMIARYERFFGGEAPAPWRGLLAPLRALMGYALDFKDLARMLETEVFPFFDE